MSRGHALPVAVRHYVNLPGPTVGAAAPCPDDQTVFLDFFLDGEHRLSRLRDRRVAPDRAVGRQRLRRGDSGQQPGASRTRSSRSSARALSPATAPTSGASSPSTSAISRRPAPQLYYNGVTPSTNANTLKAMEANWVTVGGYPGPEFPAAVTPPDPNDQVATLDGNSTGIAIDAITDRFRPGRGGPRLHLLRATSWRSRTSRSPRRRRSRSRRPAPWPVPARSRSRGTRPSPDGRAPTLADTRDAANPMVLGTLSGGATPITYAPERPSRRHSGPATTVDLDEHHDERRRGRHLHALDPGPGRQPLSHDQVGADGDQGRARSAATSRSPRTPRSSPPRPSATPSRSR